MKKKLYTIQHESENALQALQASPISLSTEKKNTSSIITAHSIVQYGYYQTIAQKVLADYNIKENLPTNQIENKNINSNSTQKQKHSLLGIHEFYRNMILLVYQMYFIKIIQ